jgi:hypothetical protein
MEFRIAHATFGNINSTGGVDDRAALEAFVKHLNVVRHVLRKRDTYYASKHTLRSGFLHCRPGELAGCECPTDTCFCMKNPSHPLHAGAMEEMLPRLNALKREYRAVLERYRVEHKDLEISDDEA